MRRTRAESLLEAPANRGQVMPSHPGGPVTASDAGYAHRLVQRVRNDPDDWPRAPLRLMLLGAFGLAGGRGHRAGDRRRPACPRVPGAERPTAGADVRGRSAVAGDERKAREWQPAVRGVGPAHVRTMTWSTLAFGSLRLAPALSRRLPLRAGARRDDPGHAAARARTPMRRARPARAATCCRTGTTTGSRTSASGFASCACTSWSLCASRLTRERQIRSRRRGRHGRRRRGAAAGERPTDADPGPPGGGQPKRGAAAVRGLRVVAARRARISSRRKTCKGSSGGCARRVSLRWPGGPRRPARRRDGCQPPP